MQFRPCIDIHDGKVKQIVGATLTDNEGASENYVSSKDAAYYADLYKSDGLKYGHVILLNKVGTDEYELSKAQGLLALKTFPGGMQIGGGITANNAKEFIEAGASHVIVTSYVFHDGKICYNRLDELQGLIGKEHIVLDLSCRKKGDDYYVVTDRWQRFTEERLNENLIYKLSEYCDEFLVHAVDVEGKVNGIETEVVKLVKDSPIPVTYAGGISSIEDILLIKKLSDSKVNVTVGSALNLFGGYLQYEEVIKCIRS